MLSVCRIRAYDVQNQRFHKDCGGGVKLVVGTSHLRDRILRATLLGYTYEEKPNFLHLKARLTQFIGIYLMGIHLMDAPYEYTSWDMHLRNAPYEHTPHSQYTGVYHWHKDLQLLLQHSNVL